MSRITAALVLAGALVASTAVQAQQGGRRAGPPQGGMPQGGARQAGPPMGAPMSPMMGGPGRDAAAMLLARTGELKLSDAQVTRLAAVARRADERRRSLRASADSMRTANAPREGAPADGARPVPRINPQARAMFEKLREQQHNDLRDALAILTPDQQATAWQQMQARGGMRHGARGMRGGPARMQRGADTRDNMRNEVRARLRERRPE